MHKVIISYIIMYYQVPSYKQSGRFFSSNFGFCVILKNNPKVFTK